MTLCFGVSAFADHSLSSAMSDSWDLQNAVEATMSANGVVCDTDFSKQTYVVPGDNTSWKQIALCFNSEDDMYAARAAFENGNSLGFYGAPGVVGVLVAKYTWVEYGADKVISVTYQ